LPLSLDTREVDALPSSAAPDGLLPVAESESLRAHVDWLLRDRRSIVLHMGEVGFIDSSGLGTMVRSLTSIRRAHGDLKLCNVTEPVRKVLEMSRLTQVFDAQNPRRRRSPPFIAPEPPRSPAETPSPPAAAFCASTAIATCLPTCANCCTALDTTFSPPAIRRRFDPDAGHQIDLLLAGPDLATSPARSRPSRSRARGSR